MSRASSTVLVRQGPVLEEDLARAAAARLRTAFRQRHDGAVLADLLEEEVRTSLQALEAVRAHLEDVLRVLLSERPAPLDFLEAGDDGHAQAALAELESALGGVRRRMGQAAARLASPPR